MKIYSVLNHWMQLRCMYDAVHVFGIIRMAVAICVADTIKGLALQVGIVSVLIFYFCSIWM